MWICFGTTEQGISLHRPCFHVLHNERAQWRSAYIRRSGTRIDHCQNDFSTKSIDLKSKIVPEVFQYFCHKPVAAPLPVVHFGYILISVLFPLYNINLQVGMFPFYICPHHYLNRKEYYLFLLWCFWQRSLSGYKEALCGVSPDRALVVYLLFYMENIFICGRFGFVLVCKQNKIHYKYCTASKGEIFIFQGRKTSNQPKSVTCSLVGSTD